MRDCVWAIIKVLCGLNKRFREGELKTNNRIKRIEFKQIKIQKLMDLMLTKMNFFL